MKKAFLFMGVVSVGVSLIFLGGCSSFSHQVVTSSDSCRNCHSDEMTLYELSDAPAKSTVSGGTVIVETTESVIKVCYPLFTSEDGAHFVPVLNNQIKVADASMEIKLEPGMWVLCTESEDSISSQLVSVESASSEMPTIKLA